jgi:hypothetical protein
MPAMSVQPGATRDEGNRAKGVRSNTMRNTVAEPEETGDQMSARSDRSCEELQGLVAVASRPPTCRVALTRTYVRRMSRAY